MLNRPTIFALATSGAAIMALAISACTTTPAPAGAAARSNVQCFSASSVNNFNPNADGTVDIQSGMGKYYRLTLGAGCPQINWAFQVGLRSTGGGDFICGGNDAELYVPDPAMGTQRCPVTGIVQLTREQYESAKRK